MLFFCFDVVFFNQFRQNQTQGNTALGLFGEQISRQWHRICINSTLCQVLTSLVHQTVDFHAHQRFWQFDWGGIQQRLHCIFFHLCLQAAFDFAGNVFTNFFAHFAHITIRDTKLFCKSFVDFWQGSCSNIFHGDGKHSGFTSHFFTVVILRESHRYITAFAFGQTDNASLEFRQHLPLTQHKREVLRATTGKRFTIDGAFEIDNHTVAFSSSAFDTVETGALFTQNINGLINFSISHFGHWLFDFFVG